MPRKSDLRRGYSKISIQTATSPKKISGWPVSLEDDKPIKNLNGRPSRAIQPEFTSAFFKDIQGYWRRTDTSVDVDFDELCVATHGHIRRSIVSDVEFMIYHDRIPDWVHMAGIEPESRVTKQRFEQLLARSQPDAVLHKFLYLQDVQGLLTNLQRTSAQISQVVGEFYGILNDSVFYIYSPNERVGFRSSVSAATALLHAHLETTFVRLRSMLDYAVKLALEAECTGADFSKIVKLRGASKQYIDKKELRINGKEGTLFVKDELIWMISSIRDRIVHDGHLDISARVYENFKRARLVERFVLIPDMTDGRFDTFKNRTNFYGRDLKINYDLPKILDEFYRRLLRTIGFIHDAYAAKRLS